MLENTQTNSFAINLMGVPVKTPEKVLKQVFNQEAGNLHERLARLGEGESLLQYGTTSKSRVAYLEDLMEEGLLFDGLANGLVGKSGTISSEVIVKAALEGVTGNASAMGSEVAAILRNMNPDASDQASLNNDNPQQSGQNLSH